MIFPAYKTWNLFHDFFCSHTQPCAHKTNHPYRCLTRVLENHKFPKHFCFLISSFVNQAISDNLMNFSFSANLELFLRSSRCCWGKVNWFPVVVRVKGFYSNLWESREHCVIIWGERHFRQDFKCDAPCDAVGDWDAKIVHQIVSSWIMKCHLGYLIFRDVIWGHSDLSEMFGMNY